jgi:hypothetical protein
LNDVISQNLDIPKDSLDENQMNHFPSPALKNNNKKAISTHKNDFVS